MCPGRVRGDATRSTSSRSKRGETLTGLGLRWVANNRRVAYNASGVTLIQVSGEVKTLPFDSTRRDRVPRGDRGPGKIFPFLWRAWPSWTRREPATERTVISFGRSARSTPERLTASASRRGGRLDPRYLLPPRCESDAPRRGSQR